ncbi:hypothetical protein OIU77_013167 [Salix suchowensis]|uniref:Uncharacterized protein n=1 Tax=Salix suchowensis TaxID=1278906 RepID=A0ABQ8ZTJ9_9ROSI|nr:hypothetical protein OIU77_013167 [Salix suchowensis]
MCNITFTLLILSVFQLNLVLLLCADPETKTLLGQHKHSVSGFPTLVSFSCGTSTSYSKNTVDVLGQLSVFPTALPFFCIFIIVLRDVRCYVTLKPKLNVAISLLCSVISAFRECLL